jgi:hypothetical protein
MWEYRAVYLDHDAEAAERALDDLGKDGWELVAVIPREGGGALAFLKRKRAARPPS